jgi:hypothetical protein
LDDWYKVSVEDFHQHGGGALLDRFFEGSLIKTMHSLYPHHEWLPWRFNQNIPQRFWDSKSNQKKFLDWLGKHLDYNYFEDWYRISANDIRANGGDRLLRLHAGSYAKLLQSVYPEYDWMIWKFKQTPKGFWNVEENQKKFVNWLGKQLGVKHFDDWYRISMEDIMRVAPITLFEMYPGGKMGLLAKIYPHYPWNLTNAKAKLCVLFIQLTKIRFLFQKIQRISLNEWDSNLDVSN